MLITSQKIGGKPSDNMADLLTAPQYMPSSEALMLECWTCVKRQGISSRMYRFGKTFDLGEAVREVGWIAGIDFRRQRKLAFCSESCKEKAQTKDGQFRMQRPR